MTKDEAKFYFQDCQGDPNDCFQDKLFEYKQFFALKPVISKVFQSKLDKLHKLNEALNTLLEKGEEDRSFQSIEVPAFSENMLSSFNTYYQTRNKLRQLVFASKNGVELANCVRELLNLESVFVDHVTSFFTIGEVDVKLSAEPNPMDILSDLKQLDQKQVSNFQDLDLNGEKNSITEEIKRLHLWRQY